MRRKLGLLGLALVLFVAPSAANAQVQTGNIRVRTFDTQGLTVPGVTVSLTASVLPQPIVGITDSAGVFVTRSLTPATYTVRATLQGFQAVVRESVIVVQNQTVNIEMTLKVGTTTTEIIVTAATPVVDTKTTNVRVNIDKDILTMTPGGKDIWSLLEYKAPGVVFDTPDVGGNQAGLQRGLSSRGTPNGQNTQLLNGVNVNDPAAQGFSMNYYVPTTFENIQVSTGSQDITIGTAGVVINMVSKSGSNRFFFQELETCQGNCGPFRTQSHNVDTKLLAAGLRGDSNAVDYITNNNAQAGGPLVRNRLFYFGSVNYQPTHVNVVGFPSIPPAYLATPQHNPLANTSNEDTTDILAGEGKLNFTLNSNNRFEGYLSKQRYDKPNRGSGTGVTQDSDSKELDTFVITQLAWNLVLTDRLFADTRLSYNNTHFPLSQKTNLQPLSDNTTGNLYRNRTSTQAMYRRRLQVVSNWQYFIPELLAGRHELKWGVDNGYTPEDVTTTRVDNVNLTFTSSNGLPARVTLFNSPTYIKRAVNTTALYLQDSYSLKRLTVIGGVRWERVEGLLPAQVHGTDAAAGPYFQPGTTFNSVTFSYTTPDGKPTSVTGPYTVPDHYDAVRADPLWKNFAGRFNLTYDIRGTGKLVFKMSAGKYLDQISTGTPPNPNGTISQAYNWVDNGDYIFQPGQMTWNGTNYVAVPGTGSELGTCICSNSIANPFNPLTFNKSLKRPTRNEFTAGVDIEPMANMLVSVTFIHRREHNNQGNIDQNENLWDTNYTKVTLTEPGPDGVQNTGDENSVEAYNLNPGVTVSSITVNDDRLAVRYNGIEISMTKRYSKGWTALIGYNYGKTQQDLISLGNPNNVRVNAGGISGGRRHIFNGSLSYTLPWHGILVATEFRVQSGLPITRTWTPSTCSATVTTNCLNQGQSLNVTPRGAIELPWLSSADFRLGKVFRFGTHTLDLSIDVYNITNANTVFSVGTSSTTKSVRYGGDAANPVTTIANFLSPTGVLGPRIVRFNMTYGFGGGGRGAGGR